MKTYIKENMKKIIIITAILVCAVLGVGTGVLVAKILPDASKLQLVACHMDVNNSYEYTGQAVEPRIKHIVFRTEDGETVLIEKEAIDIVQYMNNVELGQASVEVTLDGYRETALLNDVFTIVLGQVKELNVESASRENINLTWKQVVGANGYIVYRSADNGVTFEQVQTIDNGETCAYQDVNISSNSTYIYKVNAYIAQESGEVHGKASGIVRQETPLATPVMSSVKNQAYNTLLVQWEAVDGAAGYQVYRSLKKDGEYECIAEISDGSTLSYTDNTCSCGIEHFYYVKAAQAIGTHKTYGEASQILSGKTLPNQVRLSGKTTDGNTKVTLSWKKSSGAQGYEIFRSKDDKSNFSLIKTIESADTLTWAESGLDKQTTYYYKVRPYCVVNGANIKGNFSGAYEKDVTFVYNGPEISGDLSVLKQYAGYKYVYGGTSTKGWDCSGFVKYVFKKHFGISLPRTSAQQATRGTKISKSNRSEWKAGDLLFYTEGSGVSHVAIYLGNGQMIHALSERYDTLIQGVDYYEKWDKKTSLTCVRRYF